MRIRIILAILAFFLINYSSPAQPKYRGFAEAGYDVFLGSKVGSEYQISTSHGVLLNGSVFVGAGLGCSYYSIDNPGYDPDFVLPEGHDGMGVFTGVEKFTGVSVPVFLNIKYLWNRNKLVTVTDLKLGLSAGYVTGWFLESGLGLGIKISEESTLFAFPFVKYAYEPNNIVTDDSQYTEGNFTSLGLKLVFEF